MLELIPYENDFGPVVIRVADVRVINETFECRYLCLAQYVVCTTRSIIIYLLMGVRLHYR